MNKKDAIELLKKQKEKLSTVNNSTWIINTASIIKDSLGENSPEYSFISQFRFELALPQNYTNSEIANALQANVNKADAYIDNCIDIIKVKGIVQPSWVDGFRNVQLRKWGISIFIISGILGYIFGAFNNPANALNQMLKNKIDSKIELRK